MRCSDSTKTRFFFFTIPNLVSDFRPFPNILVPLVCMHVDCTRTVKWRDFEIRRPWDSSWVTPWYFSRLLLVEYAIGYERISSSRSNTGADVDRRYAYAQQRRWGGPTLRSLHRRAIEEAIDLIVVLAVFPRPRDPLRFATTTAAMPRVKGVACAMCQSSTAAPPSSSPDASQPSSARGIISGAYPRRWLSQRMTEFVLEGRRQQRIIPIDLRYPSSRRIIPARCANIVGRRGPSFQ